VPVPSSQIEQFKLILKTSDGMGDVEPVLVGNLLAIRVLFNAFEMIQEARQYPSFSH